MPMSLTDCAKLLTSSGVRHHIDAADAAIRVVFITCHYTNPRGERLAIVRIETPDGGRRLRASIARAFPIEGDPAAACLTFCRMAADTPLVGVEYDAEADDLRLVTEQVVADGRLTKRQLVSTIDRLVEAAEAWHVATRAADRKRGSRRGAA